VSEDWIETNRALWDERVPIRVASEFYDVEIEWTHGIGDVVSAGRCWPVRRVSARA
jgi:hypothetical protein